MRPIAIVIFLACLAAAPAGAEPTSAQQPWVEAETLLKAANADIAQGGIRALSPRVDAIEAALTDAKAVFAATQPGDGPIYVLVDGPGETLAAMAAAQKTANAPRRVLAVPNPYPLLSLYLASYYNDVGRSEDALRILDLGLTLSPLPDLKLGSMLPHLYSERGAALEALKRWQDGLDDYDAGLKLADIKDADRARLYRGRGFCLTELGRLDDAEASYNQSLALAPGNPLAIRELEYIARLKAGGPKAPSELTLPKP